LRESKKRRSEESESNKEGPVGHRKKGRGFITVLK
jgi:hypothetical protein